MSKILISTIFSFVTVCAMAQTDNRWDLKKCIEYALLHNIALKQQEISTKQRAIDIQAAKNERLPNLSVSASQNFAFGRALTAENTYTDKNTASTTWNIGSSLNLFDGMSTTHKIRLGKINLEASLADLDKARNDITMQVAKAYMQILYDGEMRDMARRQIEIDSLQVFRLTEMFNVGKISGVELSQQKTTLAQSRLTCVQAQNRYDLSILALTQLLDLKSPEGFDVYRPDLADYEITADEDNLSPRQIFEEALLVRPEVKAEQIRNTGIVQSIKLIKSASLPQLSVNAGIGSSYFLTSGVDMANFPRQMKNNFNQFVGLSLIVPIFDRWEVRSKVKNARLDQDKQLLQIEQVKKNLYNEIQQAYYNTIAAKEKYNSSRQAGISAKANFDQVSQKYEYGKANITEFNEAKNLWLKAESELILSKYEYLFDKSLIRFYRGQSLTIDIPLLQNK